MPSSFSYFACRYIRERGRVLILVDILTLRNDLHGARCHAKFFRDGYFGTLR